MFVLWGAEILAWDFHKYPVGEVLSISGEESSFGSLFRVQSLNSGKSQGRELEVILPPEHYRLLGYMVASDWGEVSIQTFKHPNIPDYLYICMPGAEVKLPSEQIY